ncbi:PIN domain-containing protein [bacterium]|nr:PIN domain-containing protein [bacterium]MBU1615228.1 PIN domain-containing protein [bacterium]
MNDNRVFVDTNVFVYAKLEHEQNKIKKQLATQLLESLKGQVIISTQVLNEFASVLIKHHVDDGMVQSAVQAIIEDCYVSAVGLSTVKKAWEIRIKHHFSYWDSQILASALEMNCSAIYTEDLQHSQIIEQKLKIINPFEKR